MISKKHYFNFLIFMMMVTTFLPVVSNNLPPIVGSFHFYGPLFIVSIIVFDTKVFLNRNVLITLLIGFFLFYVFPLIIWTYIDDWNINEQRDEFYFIVPSLLAYYYFQTNKDFLSYSRIVNITLIFVFSTAILSIYSSIIDPMYARYLTGGYYSVEEQAYFKSIGGGTYGLANAILGLLPINIYYIKNNNKIKYNSRIVIMFLVILYLSLIRMQIFGNILIGFIIIILSFQGGKKIKRSLFIIGLLFFIALLFPTDIYARMLLYFSGLFSPSSETYFKLTDMAKYIQTGSSVATEGRAARYPELIKAFINSPILGSSFKGGEFYIGNGAHLYWMNRLAIWGVFGVLIFVQIFYQNIRYTIRKINNTEFVFYYLLSVFAILSYGLIKNIGGREVWFMLFFIIPGTYYLPLMKNKKLLNIKIK